VRADRVIAAWAQTRNLAECLHYSRDSDRRGIVSPMSRGMITPPGDFRQRILSWLAGGVLLDRQRFERGLLQMALSGYASVYNVNTCLQLGWEKGSRLARGARG